MLTTVTLKPMAFCRAREEPTAYGGQLLAEIAENWGESAGALSPHRMSSTTTIATGNDGNSGPQAHINPDRQSARIATRPLPIRLLSQPPATLPMAPTAMMMNVHQARASASVVIQPTSNGTIDQKA